MPAHFVGSIPSGSVEPYSRILGIVPNYQAVSDPHQAYVPLHASDKWKLFVTETADPYTFASAAAGAAISQRENNDPRYGYGTRAYADRFGAAVTDIATQNFFSDALLASVLHEDPRYFRRGPSSSVWNRAGYALSRVIVTRKDTGADGFNYSGVIGTGMGIAFSNAYYPAASRRSGEMESRLITSFSAAALGNLLPEFWPDVRERLARVTLRPRRIIHGRIIHGG